MTRTRLLFLALIAAGCGKSSPAAKPGSTPESVAAAMFGAFASGRPDALPGLCNDESRDEARLVCDAKPGDANWDELVKAFGVARVDGPAKRDDDTATMDYHYGPGLALSWKMDVRRVDGRWYLDRVIPRVKR